MEQAMNDAAPAIETRTYKLTGKNRQWDNTDRAKQFNATMLNTATLTALGVKKFTLTGTPEQINNSWRVLTKSACLEYERID